ncbi:MAG: hypothetical protein WD766_15370 [Gemmatimonadota bacterium]
MYITPLQGGLPASTLHRENEGKGQRREPRKDRKSKGDQVELSDGSNDPAAELVYRPGPSAG